MDSQQTQTPETVILSPEIIQRILYLQRGTMVIIRDKQGRIIRSYPQDTNKHGTAGRPPLDENYILGKLREAFLMGCTDREACLYAEINPDWLYDFQKEHPEYSEQKEMWKDNPKLQARRNLADAIKEFGDTDISKWYMERKGKDEFSTRTELTGPDGKQIESTLDKLENTKTNYNDVAEKAKSAMDSTGSAQRQVVEIDPSVQNQG